MNAVANNLRADSITSTLRSRRADISAKKGVANGGLVAERARIPARRVGEKGGREKQCDVPI